VTADRLRAAVIGLGMMGANHARVLNELPNVDLVAVADLDPAAVLRATSGRTAQGYASAEDLFAAQQPDFVVVAVPTSLHLPATLMALEAGAHVLVEKPIAAERDQAEQMIAAAESAGRLLTVGHIERFNPAIRELSRRLDAGEIGRVFQVRTSRLGPFPARVRDVGVVVDLAPHDLDVMRYLLHSEPIRLYAETEQRIHTDHEDLFTGLIKFESGAVGLLEINWLTPTKVRNLSVTGEHGMYTADYITQDLVFHANPESGSVAEGEIIWRHIKRQEPLVVELSEFAAAIRDGGTPPVDPRDALTALLLARAMVDAAQRGVMLGRDELAQMLH
jgi:UDP-N-acetylglucosamine 3-dehydrogenase